MLAGTRLKFAFLGQFTKISNINTKIIMLRQVDSRSQLYSTHTMKTQQVYLLLPISNLRGNHPIACSSKPNLSKRQSHLHMYCRCLALRTRGGVHVLCIHVCIVHNYPTHMCKRQLKQLVMLSLSLRTRKSPNLEIKATE